MNRHQLTKTLMAQPPSNVEEIFVESPSGNLFRIHSIQPSHSGAIVLKVMDSSAPFLLGAILPEESVHVTQKKETPVQDLANWLVSNLSSSDEVLALLVALSKCEPEIEDTMAGGPGHFLHSELHKALEWAAFERGGQILKES